jgi:hypothetical protein
MFCETIDRRVAAAAKTLKDGLVYARILLNRILPLLTWPQTSTHARRPTQGQRKKIIFLKPYEKSTKRHTNRKRQAKVRSPQALCYQC